MKKSIHYIYTLLFLGVAGNASARPTMEINEVSMAMITFMALSLIAFVITYLMWKFNDMKKRKVITRISNREPVKRTPIAYIHKENSAIVEEVNIE